MKKKILIALLLCLFLSITIVSSYVDARTRGPLAKSPPPPPPPPPPSGKGGPPPSSGIGSQIGPCFPCLPDPPPPSSKSGPPSGTNPPPPPSGSGKTPPPPPPSGKNPPPAPPPGGKTPPPAPPVGKNPPPPPVGKNPPPVGNNPPPPPGPGGKTPTNTPTPAGPTPTPYPTVAVSGELREYSGAACYDTIATNGMSLVLSPDTSTGVTTNCGVTPGTGTSQSSYSCTVVFDNQSSTPDPSQSLTMTTASLEYQPGYLVDPGVCSETGSSTIDVDVGASTPDTTYDKDLLFKLLGPWVKIKNGSFASSNALSNPIPAIIAAYDSEDDASQRTFIMNDASNDPGVVGASLVNTGTAEVSSEGWKGAYTKTSLYSAPTFLEYVKARKDYKNISQNDLSELEDGKTHVWTGGTLTINSSNVSQFSNKKIVLLSTGTINIADNFTPSSASTAIIADTINFDSSVTLANGIFSADSIDTGTTTDQGLKIVGNISAASFTNNRTWDETTQPSLFIVFKPGPFLDLLPDLSVSKYEYQQTQ